MLLAHRNYYLQFKHLRAFKNHFVLASVLPSFLAFIALGASAKVFIVVEKHVLPVRPGRKGPRKVKPQASVSFLYRVA